MGERFRRQKIAGLKHHGNSQFWVLPYCRYTIRTERMSVVSDLKASWIFLKRPYLASYLALGGGSGSADALFNPKFLYFNNEILWSDKIKVHYWLLHSTTSSVCLNGFLLIWESFWVNRQLACQVRKKRICRQPWTPFSCLQIASEPQNESCRTLNIRYAPLMVKSCIVHFTANHSGTKCSSSVAEFWWCSLRFDHSANPLTSRVYRWNIQGRGGGVPTLEPRTLRWDLSVTSPTYFKEQRLAPALHLAKLFGQLFSGTFVY